MADGDVTALLVSHDGVALAAGRPRRAEPARPGRPTGSSRSTPAAPTRARGCCARPRSATRAVLDAPRDQRVRRRGRAPASTPLPRRPPAPTSGSGCSTTTATPPPTRSSSCSPSPETTPSAAVLGPKLREWPSLRRLLEVGVTISGTGRRETGLERGEYDQGQHDRVRDVLAVNTAGMLVRRSVLESLGFDERLPLFGNDVDFGWRAARAGHRTVVVARRRRLPRRGRAPRRPAAPDRAGGPPPAASGPRRSTRCSSTARALGPAVHGGPALPRQPRAGPRAAAGPGARARPLDELAGLVATYLRPWRVARRPPRPAPAPSTVPAREVRPLLAPPWMPYRHGLDFVSDIDSRRRAAGR